MPIAAPAAGDRILNTDLAAFYSLLKGVAGSGEAITLVYNAAGVIAFIPSSDPAASTQLFQIKNAASTVKSALTAGGGAVFSSVINTAKSSDIASSGTTDLSTATGNYVQISGTTTITAFGTVQAGTVMVLEFQGALTLTHNATSLILRGGASATTAAGDIYIFVSEGAGNWREISHLTSSGASASSYVTTATFFDDFMGAKVDATAASPVNNIGGGGWTQRITGGAATSALIAGLANHPGIIELATGATSTHAIALYGPSASVDGILPADTFDMTWVVRPNSTVDANMEFRFGLRSGSSVSATLAAPNDGIYVEKLTGDTTYFGVTRAASSQTRTAAFGTVTNGTWTKFRIRRIDSSTIGFTQDSSAEVQATLTIPSVALQFFIEIGNHSTANSRIIDVDLFVITVASTR